MPNFFLPNYKISWAETLVFPFFPVYSDRHLEEVLASKTWLGKTVHLWTFCMERIPIVGAVIALAELILACLFQHSEIEESEPFMAKPLSPQKVEEIKEEHVFASPILKEQKKAEEVFKREFPSRVAMSPELKKAEIKEEQEVVNQVPFIDKKPSSPVIELPLDKEFIEEIVEIPVPAHIYQTPAFISPRFKGSPAMLSPFAVGEGIEVVSQQEATYKILTTGGFVRDFDDVKHASHGYKGKVQGNKVLREMTANVTKKFPHAISLEALKEQKAANIEQYLTLKLKRFGHAFGLKGLAPLPSGQKVNLEGFCEAFTVPMLTSSFEKYAHNSKFFTAQDIQWISQYFNETTSSDHIAPEMIQALAIMIQDPSFLGPISIGTGYDWHSTGAVFIGNYLIYCNRGAGGKGVYVYYLPDRQKVTEAVIWELTKRQEVNAEDHFGVKRIEQDLGGILIHSEEMSPQESGSCTYISMETVLYVFTVIRQMEKLYEGNEECLQLEIDSVIWEEAFNVLQPEYQNWQAFDRKMIFDDMIKEIQEWRQNRNPANLWATYKAVLEAWRNKRINKENSQILAVDQLLRAF